MTGLFQPYFLVFCDAYVTTLCSTLAFFPPDLKAVTFQQGIQRQGTWIQGIRCRLANCGKWQLDSQLTAAFSPGGESSACVLESTLEGKNPLLWRGLNIWLGSHNHSSNICICPSAIKLRVSHYVRMFLWIAVSTLKWSFLQWSQWCKNYSCFTHYL